MKQFFLWTSSALHFVAAIFAAVSVKSDYSNQVPMMFAALALMIGALVDAWIAIGIGEDEKKRRRKSVYICPLPSTDAAGRQLPPARLTMNIEPIARKRKKQ